MFGACPWDPVPLLPCIEDAVAMNPPLKENNSLDMGTEHWKKINAKLYGGKSVDQNSIPLPAVCLAYEN